MECPYCNAENRDGVRFCNNCGKPLDPAAARGGATVTSRSLTPGSRLQGGRYVIKKILGEGGMGAALLATDLRLDGKSVVIKELLSDNTDPTKRQEDVRNFKREVATLAHLDHPLIPNVTDHFQEGSRYFMVQEYVEGENLEERMDRVNQPMKEREALGYASEVLDILDYLSQETPPIVHRDIKPANIIIGTKDKRAHLVDFGIARADETRNTPPYPAYAAIVGVFGGGLAAAGGLARLLGRDPREGSALDLAVLAAATFKAARTITDDEVTSFLRAPFVEGEAHSGDDEEPKETGDLQQAIGELVTCSRCGGTWAAAFLASTQILAPRFGRLLTWSLAAAGANDERRPFDPEVFEGARRCVVALIGGEALGRLGAALVLHQQRQDQQRLVVLDPHGMREDRHVAFAPFAARRQRQREGYDQSD